MCRAGAATKYYYGDEPGVLGDYAWHADNSVGRPHTVGGKLPNAWGFRDMLGNVLEWCSDGPDNYPELLDLTDPVRPSSATARSSVGGSYFHAANDPILTCASGASTGRTDAMSILGFRVVQTIK
jgi:formylglycine-generating enzyme required for sulfatase activity